MSIILFRLFAALTVAFAIAPSAQAEAPMQLLQCRGGGNMLIIVTKVPGQTTLDLDFAAGQAPGKPGSGECVLSDRKLSAKEPTTLRAESPSNDIQRLAITGTGMIFGANSKQAEIVASDPLYAGIIEPVLKGEPFSLKVSVGLMHWHVQEIAPSS